MRPGSGAHLKPRFRVSGCEAQGSRGGGVTGSELKFRVYVFALSTLAVVKFQV